METPDQRREFVRWIPREKTFVALPDLARMGSITDISLGGLGCEFVISSGEKEANMNEEAAPLPADIFVSANAFYLSNVLCRVAYDVSAHQDAPAYSFNITKKRCGLKFDELTKEQEKQINGFLENRTTGRVNH